MIAGMVPMALGLGRRGRADRPARPGGHRRPRRRDARDAPRPALRLRARPGLGGPAVGVARPVRPRERLVRPGPATAPGGFGERGGWSSAPIGRGRRPSARCRRPEHRPDGPPPPFTEQTRWDWIGRRTKDARVAGRPLAAGVGLRAGRPATDGPAGRRRGHRRAVAGRDRAARARRPSAGPSRSRGRSRRSRSRRSMRRSPATSGRSVEHRVQGQQGPGDGRAPRPRGRGRGSSRSGRWSSRPRPPEAGRGGRRGGPGRGRRAPRRRSPRPRPASSGPRPTSPAGNRSSRAIEQLVRERAADGQRARRDPQQAPVGRSGPRRGPGPGQVGRGRARQGRAELDKARSDVGAAARIEVAQVRGARPRPCSGNQDRRPVRRRRDPPERRHRPPDRRRAARASRCSSSPARTSSPSPSASPRWSPPLVDPGDPRRSASRPSTGRRSRGR